MPSPSTPRSMLSRLRPTPRLWKSLHGWIGVVLCLLLVVMGGSGVFMMNRDLFGLRNAPVHFAPLEWWYGSVLPAMQEGAGGRGGARGDAPGMAPGGMVASRGGGRRGGARGEIRGEMRERARRVSYLTLYTEAGQALRVGSEAGLLVQEDAAAAWQRAEESKWNETLASVALPVEARRIPERAQGDDAAGGERVGERGGERGGARAQALTWGRVINDLHRGRFFGGRMDWFYTAGACGMVFLSLSGVWLWTKPYLVRYGKRRQLARQGASSSN